MFEIDDMILYHRFAPLESDVPMKGRVLNKFVQSGESKPMLYRVVCDGEIYIAPETRLSKYER